MKILCFGDSNTYGYDPRSFFASPYPSCWVDLLAQNPDFHTVNAGENGREIPRTERQFQDFHRLLAQESPLDLLIILLGTNDLLQGNAPEAVGRRMSRFLEQIPLEKSKILLIAPPPMAPGEWVPSRELIDASAALQSEYKTLAEDLGLCYADAGQWHIPLAWDGVHFTEKGHHFFAEGIANYLNIGE